MTLEFTVDPELTDDLGVEILACWTDVTNAGGSVGFIPPVTMDDVLPAAARFLSGVAAGHDRLIIGRAQGQNDRGRLATLAFLVNEQSPLTAHWRHVSKVMVHPDFQGRGYGRRLMAEIERVGRAMGLGLLALDCRGGTGNDEFYKKCGYVEYGRLPGALRIGEDEYRERVLLSLSLRG